MRSTSSWESSGLLLACLLASGCGASIAVPIEIEPFQIVSSDGAPAWSPDGRRIAYVHYQPPLAAGIRLVDTTGVATQQILTGNWEYLDWSPDGTRLATSAGSGIFSVRPTGDSLRAITTQGFAPRWSPTGNELAYQTVDTTGIGTIWLVSRDGTGLRSLAPTGTESWSEPDWSPDGARLVHVRRLSSSGQSDIFVMDTTGHAEQRLTADVSDDHVPAWSPDGQWIAWSVGTFAPTGEIWLMRTDGTEAHMLTYGGNPSWSPDSRHIVFTFLMYNVVRLFAIDIATLRVRPITQ
jgi:TolB protein